MQKDFHFYVTYALAKTAGYSAEDAHTIAYASQYVDDNNENQFPDEEGRVQFPSKIWRNGEYFRPVMTQSFSVKSLAYEIQKFVYVPYHFIPGDNNKPIDGQLNRYSTTPNSLNAQRLLREAIKSQDLYRLGIALHTYADTWSHQNFTGYEEDWNSVFVWHSPYRAIVPNIGHADVGHSADEISIEWIDERLEKPERKINNRERALEAAKLIYQALRRATKAHVYWSDVRNDFKGIMDAADYDDRLKKVRDLVGAQDLKYQKSRWIDEAVKRSGYRLEASENFEATDWFKFQQAAKAHLALVMDMLKNY